MTLFEHHLYELQKGVRHLVCYTARSGEVARLLERLRRSEVSFYVQRVSDVTSNIFFGEASCVAVVERLAGKMLNKFSDEEDFLLGILLGYDPVQQCRRYLKRKDDPFTNRSIKSA